MIRFQHCIEWLTTSQLADHEDLLERMSNAGWELVTVYETANDWRFAFKRPVELPSTGEGS